MTMKVNFSSKTVTMAKTLSFTEMATLEDVLQTAAFEASENGHQEKAINVMELADTFGIEIEVDLITKNHTDALLTDGDSDPKLASEQV